MKIAIIYSVISAHSRFLWIVSAAVSGDEPSPSKEANLAKIKNSRKLRLSFLTSALLALQQSTRLKVPLSPYNKASGDPAVPDPVLPDGDFSQILSPSFSAAPPRYAVGCLESPPTVSN